VTHVVVTGGGSGIGRAAALLLAAEGSAVAVLDRDRDAAAAVAEAAADSPGVVWPIECDVAQQADVSAAFDEAEARLGSVRGLFAAAGVDLSGFAHEMTVARWHEVLAVNLTGTFLVAREAIRRMVAVGRGGAIVLCSSPAAQVAFAGGMSAYAASKGGVSALTRSLAVDYAPHGIRVNALVPGATETPLMWASVAEDERPEMRRVVEAEIPLGRLADPIEPATAAVWLLSDGASYVTGSHLACDGGILAKASISV